MRQNRQVLTMLLLAGVAGVVAIAAAAARAQGPSINAGPMAGIVWKRGLATAASHGAHTQNPDLVYHGGPVRTSGTTVYPIYWGTSWTTGSAVVSALQSFYTGVGGSAYAKTNTEYKDGSGKFVSATVTGAALKIDNSPAVSRAPQTSDILAEVARVYPNPTAGAYYPVYIDQPRGHASYCAWHSAGTINGVPVQFGFFFKLDGDAGCDPQSSSGQPEGIAALGNVSGHELSEMLTDPQLNAWYDSKGAENADKCAWTFGPQLIKLGSTSWKIQGNWSNYAYDHGQGYIDADAGLVRGCIDGS